MARGRIRIGISGWRYPPWRKVFYPEGLVHKNELAYAASKLSSIEINGTFYSLQRPESFEAWEAAVPKDFQFAVKGPRYITHIRRLADVETPLANFFASGVLKLGPKLGPCLWQLPPNMKFDAQKIEAFFRQLPRDTDDVVRLAKKHDARMAGRSWLKSGGSHAVRHALEIRHDSFRDPAFINLLRKHGVACVCADTVAWPRLMDVTANFCYLRLHGSEELYANGYNSRALDLWGRRIDAWSTGAEPDGGDRASGRKPPALKKRDVYVYFDNDAKARAPFDALSLIRKLRRKDIL